MSARQWLDPFLAPVLCGAFAFVVYALTLAPSVSGGDAGELIVVAARLEVAHPPGYPLYTLLAHLFALGPWSPALGVNAFSAACEAVAVGLLCAALEALTRRRDVAALLALCFAFSPVVWTWATSAEVFALHHLFVAALVWSAVRLAQAPSERRVVVVGLVVGVGLSHHHTLLFSVPPVALLVWLVTRGRPWRLRALALALGATALGLLPYLYLPLASRTATTLSMGDPGTLEGFVDHLLRREYGTFRLASEGLTGGGGLSHKLWLYAASFGETTLYVGWPLLLAGAVALVRGRFVSRALGVALVVVFPLYTLPFLALANLDATTPLFAGVLSRFFGQGHLLGVALAAVGLSVLTARWAHKRALSVALLALAAIPLLWHLPAQRSGHGRHVEDYGRALLAGLPEGAVLLSRGDLSTNAARYAQVGLGLRPDVTLLDQELLTRRGYVERARRQYAGLRFPGERYHPREAGAFDLAAVVEANPERTFFVYPSVKDGDASLNGRFALVPEGLVQRVVPRSSLASWQPEGDPLAPLREMPWPERARLEPEAWERVIHDELLAAFHRRGVFLLEQAMARGSDRRLLEEARAVLEETRARAGGEVPWYVWKNLGLTYALLAAPGSDGVAAAGAPQDNARAVAAWQAYLEAAPPDEPDRRRIVEALREMEGSR